MRRKNKKIKIGLFILIVIVFVSITIGLIFNIQNTSQELNQTKKVQKIILECENIDNPLLKEECYKTVAIKTANISICEKIKLHYQAADECYLHFAEKNNNFSLCRKIILTENRDYCYLKFAKEKRDPSLCEKITDAAIKKLCYNTTTNIVNTTLEYGIVPAKEEHSITEKGTATIWVRYLDDKNNSIQNATVILKLYRMEINGKSYYAWELPKEFSMHYSMKNKYYYFSPTLLSRKILYCYEVYAAKKGYKSVHKDLGCVKLVE